MTLYTLVGLPASGKSTFSATRKDCVVVCPDAIRKAVLGNEADQKNGGLIFAIAWKQINKALSQGKDVIFDATNCQKKYRKSIFQKAPEGTKHIAVVFNTPIEVCKQRNASRERKVPEEVIDRMWANFSKPTKEEGFDEIIEINP